MASASFAIAPTADVAVSANAPAKGLLARFMDRLIAAREAQARREIARHSHMARFEHTPETLELFARD